MVFPTLDDVTRVVINSEWSGLGDPVFCSAELEIVERHGSFYVENRTDCRRPTVSYLARRLGWMFSRGLFWRDEAWGSTDSLVETTQLKTLLSTLDEPPIKRPDVTNMGFSPGRLDQELEALVERFFGDDNEEGKKRLRAKLSESGYFAKLVCDQFNCSWTDDYPRASVSIYFRTAKPIIARSSSQHAFMIPWEIRWSNKTICTYNARIGQAVACLLPDGFLNKESLSGQHAVSHAHALARLWFSHIPDVDLLGPPTKLDRPTKTVHGHQKRISTLLLTMDERHLISGGWDDTVKVWDTRTWNERGIFDMPRTGVNLAVAIGADNVTVAFNDATVIRLGNLATGQVTGTLMGHSWVVRTIAFCTDGTQLASEDSDGIILWDLVQHNDRERIKGERLLGFSFDSEKLLTTAQQSLMARNLKNSKATPITNKCRLACLSSNGNRVAWATGDPTIHLWDLQLGRELNTVDVPALVTNLAFTRTGSMLGCIDEDGAIRLFCLQDHPAAQIVLNGRSGVRELTFSDDASTLIAHNEECFVLWDTTSRKHIRTVYTPGIECLTASRNGKTLWTGHSDGSFNVWANRSAAGPTVPANCPL